MERKMASIRKIDSIEPIEGADKIEVAVFGGWKVVVNKGLYQSNDLVVFCEIDSWVPNSIAPFLTQEGKEPREYKGVKGERLRTKKLRGVISQGLVLPTFKIKKCPNIVCISDKDGVSIPCVEGKDVSEFLGIQKWEPPEEFRSADAKGLFPSFIRKTDQERIQNIRQEVEDSYQIGKFFEVTEKLDGSSMTVFYLDGNVGVCSRNLELKEDENNTFWKTAKSSGAIDALTQNAKNIALQGELVGPGIQGNSYGLAEHEYYIYDVFDIDNQEYLLPYNANLVAKSLGLKYVPVIAEAQVLTTSDISAILKGAEGKSILNSKTEREGLVFKCSTEDFSFKAISNKWLLKNE